MMPWPPSSNSAASRTSYAAAKEVDGKIIRALPGDPYVYVNLGAKDRVTLGMTFSVYSAGEGIPTTGEGKATIEITSVYDDVAAGKIISRSRNQPVLEGDLVANAIYSKTRKHKFLVVGRFDLDNTGIATAAETPTASRPWSRSGAARSSIRSTRHRLRRARPRPGPADRPAGDRLADRQAALPGSHEGLRGFPERVTEAKSLMVPMLNQTQFLHFVGYNLDAMRSGKAQAAN